MAFIAALWLHLELDPMRSALTKPVPLARNPWTISPIERNAPHARTKRGWIFEFLKSPN
jgi:hypothetical protein